MNQSDKIISKKLNQSQVYTSDWEKMRSQIDDQMGLAPEDPSTWDSEIRHSMATQTHPSDWSSMQSLWTQHQQRARQIRLTRAVEITLIAILLITLNYRSVSTTKSQQHPKTSKAISQKNIAIDDHQASSLHSVIHSENSKDEESQYSQTSSPEMVMAHHTALDRPEKNILTKDNQENRNQSVPSTKKLEKKPFSAAASNNMTVTKDATDLTITGFEFQAHELGNTLETQEEPSVTSAKSSSNIPSDRRKNSVVPEAELRPLTSLSPIATKRTQISGGPTLSSQLHSKSSDQLPLPIKTIPNQSSWLSVYSGISLNYILTPASNEFHFGRYDHATYNAHLGLSYTMERKLWSFRAGAEYWNPSYQSRNISSIVAPPAGQPSYIAYQPRNIEFHIIKIPLQVDYEYRMGHYVTAGAALGYVFSSSFDLNAYEIEVLSDGSFQSNPADDPQNQPPSFTQDGFRENSFLSLRLGWGIRQQVNSNLRWYFEPQAQLHIGQGIGPSSDIIHQFGAQIGLQYKLSQ